VLLQVKDSAYAGGTTTQDNGSFCMAKPNVETFAKITYLGYQMKEMAVKADMGRIVLEEDPKVLGEVVVKGSVPKAKIEGTSLVMNVENTVLSQFGTAADVLTQIPTLTKKGDSYEVIGKGTPLIYINGRQVRDNRELQELKSDQIKSVEVDMNPGARYDATVSSVIRIKTKRAVGEGFSVEMGTWVQQDKGTSNNEWLNMAYRTKNWELFANLFAEPNKESNQKNYYDETVTADTLWNIHSEERIHEHSNYYSGKLGFNYNTDKHSFGAYYQNDHSYNKLHEDTYYNMKGDGKDYDNLTNNSFSKQKTWPNHLVNIYYNGTVGKWMLDFNTDLIYRKYTDTTQHKEQGERTEDDRTVTIESANKTLMLAEKLVATHPLWKGTIGFGEELTAIKRINDYTNAEGLFANDNNETHETNIAPFAELSQQLGKWQLTLGLRYEHTASNYFVGGRKQAEQSRTYDYLFPSFDAATVWNNIRLSFSYSAKTGRPNFTQLNSTMIYGNRLSYEKGNPLLKPSISHNFNIMAMWKYYFLMTSYNFINDDIQYAVENYEGDEKIQLATYKNYDHRSYWLLTLGAQKAIGVWNINYSATVLKQWFTVEHDNGMVDSYNQPLFFFKLNNTFNLPRKWLVRLDYELHTTGHGGNVYAYRAEGKLNFSASKDFFGDKLHVQLDCNDILRTNYNDIMLHSNNFTFRRHNDFYNRSVSLTLRYRFNFANSKYKGTGAGNAEKARL